MNQIIPCHGGTSNQLPPSCEGVVQVVHSNRVVFDTEKKVPLTIQHNQLYTGDVSTNRKLNTEPRGTRQKITPFNTNSPSGARDGKITDQHYRITPPTRDHDGENEIHDLSSTGTPVTIPFMNGLSPDSNHRGRDLKPTQLTVPQACGLTK